MKIALVGKFTKLHDEEYIARAFESLGHEVKRIPQHHNAFDITLALSTFRPKVLLYCKWNPPQDVWRMILILKREGMKTICWLFDLYFGYQREYQVRNMPFFRSDHVFTTDGGHQKEFVNMGIKHQCLRQGIFSKECVLLPFKKPKYDVIFVGSDNPMYQSRTDIVMEIGAKWFGQKNTDDKRGMELNELYAESKIVIGDSFYSPHYWSNRVVETLGRGGFLIHQDVPGLKELYPDLVTYERGNVNQLKEKIAYYLTNEKERREIIKKNFERVREHHTAEIQCKTLLELIK